MVRCFRSKWHHCESANRTLFHLAAPDYLECYSSRTKFHYQSYRNLELRKKQHLKIRFHHLVMTLQNIHAILLRDKYFENWVVLVYLLSGNIFNWVQRLTLDWFSFDYLILLHSLALWLVRRSHATYSTNHYLVTHVFPRLLPVK